MSNYIEVTNGNRIIINDTYHNFGVISKITSFSWTKALTQYASLYYFILSLPDNQLLFVHCSSPNYAFTLIRLGDGTAKFMVFCLNNASINNIAGKLTIYVYGESTATGNTGLQIINANGVPIFDSTRTYLRMIGVVNYVEEGTSSFSHKIAVTPPFAGGWNLDESDEYTQPDCCTICFPTESSIEMEAREYYLPDGSIDGGYCGLTPLLVANIDN
jgi:hypothetical protein